MENNFKKGSVNSFDNNWKLRPETIYNHWSKDNPKNQIQLAFSQHYNLFNSLINISGKLKVLEVGCGRGSLSSHFSSNGHDCHLLDISETVISTAKVIFKNNNHNASFYVGDANALKFNDNTFDVVFSIGLLEHFESIDQIITEQYRVLKKGGILINYIVPENNENVQKDFNWINDILKVKSRNKKYQAIDKEDLYRSDSNSKIYIEKYIEAGFKDIFSSGVYPLPMISHSVDFPFTLMDDESESILVKEFTKILEKRKKTNQHPWLCDENYGQAFIVTGKKS